LKKAHICWLFTTELPYILVSIEFTRREKSRFRGNHSRFEPILVISGAILDQIHPKKHKIAPKNGAKS
jgi:hypothetical protein